MNYREEFNKAINILCLGEGSYVETDFLRNTFNKLMDADDENSKYLSHLECVNRGLQDKLANAENDNMILEEARGKTSNYISKLQDEIIDHRKEFNILSTHYEEVKRISSSRYELIGDLQEARERLLNDNMKLSEEIDSMTSEEDSLSIEELKTITFCVDHFQLIFPNLFHKLTSMIEIHDVPKEMTVEEIEKQLGHSIKVVK